MTRKEAKVARAASAILGRLASRSAFLHPEPLCRSSVSRLMSEPERIVLTRVSKKRYTDS
jgi:hypothetical protein